MTSTRIEELDAIASNYHLNDQVPDKFIEDLCQHHCCDWLATLIQPTDRVIELGYGEGITLSRLSQLTPHYSVIEGARSLVQVIRQRHPQVDVISSLFEDHKPNQRCDKLLALHVFEHVDNPISLGRHLRTWLQPDGEILVIVPNKDSLHRQLALEMGLINSLDELSPRDHLVGHQRIYDLNTLTHDLMECGFEPFESKGFFLKTLPNGMMLNFSPDLIKALNTVGDQLPAKWMANIAIRAKLRKA